MNALNRVIAQVQQAIEADQRKIGGLSMGASGRAGLEELRRAFTLDGSIASQTQTPAGMYGTITPGEVAEMRKDDGNVYGPEVEPGAEAASPTVSREADPVSAAQQQSAASSAQRTRDGNGKD